MHHPEIFCRLCDSAAVYMFSIRLLQRLDVAFYRCSRCESLQAEEPYWLEEAYSDACGIPDIAATARLQCLVPLTFFAAKILGLGSSGSLLDFGGGDGFLVRRLRDLGLNAYLLDKYTTNRYAVGFEAEENICYGLVTAFEVWKHFVNPKQEIQKLFSFGPDFLLISTGVYDHQDSMWPYLTPLSGRHVFFYSLNARRMIAQRFGYGILTRGPYAVFHRDKLSTLQIKALQIAFSATGQCLLAAVLGLIPQSPRLEADRRLARQVVESGGAGKINWP